MSNLIGFVKVLFIAAIFTMFALSEIKLANAYEVPKDAIIKVYDASGKQIGEMSRKEYKVVKIEKESSNNNKSSDTTTTKKTDVKYVEKPNTIIVHAGTGQGGIYTKSTNSGYEVKSKQVPVGGVTYCRSKNNKGVCATGMTNETFTLGVKVNF